MALVLIFLSTGLPCAHLLRLFLLLSAWSRWFLQANVCTCRFTRILLLSDCHAALQLVLKGSWNDYHDGDCLLHKPSRLRRLHSLREADLLRTWPAYLYGYHLNGNWLAVGRVCETARHGSFRKNDPLQHRVIYVRHAHRSNESLKWLHI